MSLQDEAYTHGFERGRGGKNSALEMFSGFSDEHKDIAYKGWEDGIRIKAQENVRSGKKAGDDIGFMKSSVGRESAFIEGLSRGWYGNRSSEGIFDGWDTQEEKDAAMRGWQVGLSLQAEYGDTDLNPLFPGHSDESTYRRNLGLGKDDYHKPDERSKYAQQGWEKGKEIGQRLKDRVEAKYEREANESVTQSAAKDLAKDGAASAGCWGIAIGILFLVVAIMMFWWIIALSVIVYIITKQLEKDAIEKKAEWYTTLVTKYPFVAKHFGYFITGLLGTICLIVFTVIARKDGMNDGQTTFAWIVIPVVIGGSSWLGDKIWHKYINKEDKGN